MEIIRRYSLKDKHVFEARDFQCTFSFLLLTFDCRRIEELTTATGYLGQLAFRSTVEALFALYMVEIGGRALSTSERRWWMRLSWGACAYARLEILASSGLWNHTGRGRRSGKGPTIVVSHTLSADSFETPRGWDGGQGGVTNTGPW